jgi:hypothetical protein
MKITPSLSILKNVVTPSKHLCVGLLNVNKTIKKNSYWDWPNFLLCYLRFYQPYNIYMNKVKMIDFGIKSILSTPKLI